jgi:hypothetical protein
MPHAAQFQGMLSSVLPSQDAEVILGKQPVLADHGREVRAAISAMPPEVSRSLMSEYREPTPQLVSSIEDTILMREHAIDNAEKGIGLDQQWAAGDGPGRKLSEQSIGEKDPWMEEDLTP